jgi:hypothetical protein
MTFGPGPNALEGQNSNSDNFKLKDGLLFLQEDSKMGSLKNRLTWTSSDSVGKFGSGIDLNIQVPETHIQSSFNAIPPMDELTAPNIPIINIMGLETSLLQFNDSQLPESDPPFS